MKQLLWLLCMTLLVLFTSIQASDAPTSIPVLATCRPATPGSIPWVALSASCAPSDLQAACNVYHNMDLKFKYGASQATGCVSFEKLEDLQSLLSLLNSGTTPRFGGQGGTAVLCQTNTVVGPTGGLWYAEPAPDCQDETKKSICGDNAKPVSCMTWDQDDPLIDFLNRYPKLNALECKLKVGGTAYRSLVPLCDPKIIESQCPSDATEVKSCAKLTPENAQQWIAEKMTNPALVSCKIKKTGKTFKRPARDCDQDTMQSACPQDSAYPTDCKVYKDLKGLAKHLA